MKILGRLDHFMNINILIVHLVLSKRIKNKISSIIPFHVHPESVDYLRKITDGSLNDIIFPWEEVQDDKMAHTFGDLYYGLEEKGIGKKQFDSVTQEIITLK